MSAAAGPVTSDPPPAAPLRLVVADDNPVVRAGMSNLLSTVPGLSVVGSAADGRAALAMVDQLRPDLALLDVRMPHVDGIAVAQAIAATVPVLMLTHSDEPEVIASALAAGARGYVVHSEFDVDEIVAAIRTVAAGGVHLSPAAGRMLARSVTAAAQSPAPEAPRRTWGLSHREQEVMELIAEGRTNGEIARTCFLSEKTVKNHVNRIFAKLCVTSRAEAVSVWLRR